MLQKNARLLLIAGILLAMNLACRGTPSSKATEIAPVPATATAQPTNTVAPTATNTLMPTNTATALATNAGPTAGPATSTLTPLESNFRPYVPEKIILTLSQTKKQDSQVLFYFTAGKGVTHVRVTVTGNLPAGCKVGPLDQAVKEGDTIYVELVCTAKGDGSFTLHILALDTNGQTVEKYDSLFNVVVKAK